MKLNVTLCINYMIVDICATAIIYLIYTLTDAINFQFLMLYEIFLQ